MKPDDYKEINKDEDEPDSRPVPGVDDSFLLASYSVDGDIVHSLILKKINESVYDSLDIKNIRISESFKLPIELISCADLIKNYLIKMGNMLSLNDKYVLIEHTSDDCYGYILVGLSSISFTHIFPTIFSETLEGVHKILDDVKSIVEPILREDDIPKLNINWYTTTDGRSDSYYATEYLDDKFHPECYPYFDVHDIIKEYTESEVPVIFILGPPGTGKTRLIREILKQMYIKKKNDIDCIYTSSREIIESGSVYLNLIFNDIDVLVLEDIDYHITPRKEGNTSMYNLLSVSNGILSNTIKKKKIILSSNLPHKSNIDEALLRPGRCFATIETRRLHPEEADVVCSKIGKVRYEGLTSYSLADLYNC
jgi:hypothetical protein